MKLLLAGFFSTPVLLARASESYPFFTRVVVSAIVFNLTYGELLGLIFCTRMLSFGLFWLLIYQVVFESCLLRARRQHPLSDLLMQGVQNPLSYFLLVVFQLVCLEGGIVEH